MGCYYSRYSCGPDVPNFKTNVSHEYLGIEEVFLDGILDFVSGEHEVYGSGMPKLSMKRVSFFMHSLFNLM